MDVRIEVGKYYTWEPFVLAGKTYDVAIVQVTEITPTHIKFRYANRSDRTDLPISAFMAGVKSVTSLELFLLGIHET